MIKNFSNSTWLDDQGLKLGFIRFENENIIDYRKRVLHYLNNLPENTEQGFIDSQNLELGKKDRALFEIHLKRYEADDEIWNVALDPRVEIDSNFFRVWSNYRETENNPDLEVDLRNRKDGYFLEDIFNKVKELDFIEVKVLDEFDNWKYLKSQNLKHSTSLDFVSKESLRSIQYVKLVNENIRDIFFENTSVYTKEVNSYDLVDWEDFKNSNYYVDKVKGRIWSTRNGSGSCTYSYHAFPFKIMWQVAKTVPFNDKSIDHLIKDNLINENGLSERLLLNSYGARIVNEILATHSLQWGK